MLSELLIVLALILANGLFSGAEIAVVSLRRTRILELVEMRQSGARALLALRDDIERFLATIQVGITVVGATAAAFGGASIAERIAPGLARIDWLAPYASEVALSIVVVGISFLSIVIGELVPKSLALRAGEGYALILARPLQILAWLATPVVQLLTAASNVLLRPFGDQTTFSEARHSTSEVLQIVEEAVEAGTVHEAAGEIATRALELPELTVADIMIPRKDVVLVPANSSSDQLRAAWVGHRYSRLPVYAKDIEDIIGYINVKDLLENILEGREMALQEVVRAPHFVPETQLAVDLLHDMRAKRIQLGIVVDEQGTMTGLVTLEDVLEELVGDFGNEHGDASAQPIRREAPGVTVVSASLPVREVNRALDLDLPEDGAWTTVGGLSIALAGRIPAVGDVVELADGVRLEVVDASARRVRTLRVRVPVGERSTTAGDA